MVNTNESLKYKLTLPAITEDKPSSHATLHVAAGMLRRAHLRRQLAQGLTECLPQGKRVPLGLAAGAGKAELFWQYLG